MLVPRSFTWLVQQQKNDIVRKENDKDTPNESKYLEVTLNNEHSEQKHD